MKAGLAVGILTFAVMISGCSSLESPASRDYTPVPQSTPTPSPIPKVMRMVILGDSIAQGGTNGWPQIVARHLGLFLYDRAQGGTGYVNEPSYGTRAGEIVTLNPDVVIVEGSRNDNDPVRTRQGAAQALGKLRSGLPQAKILVIGPIYSFATNVGTTPVNDAVKAAAASLGLPYVDTVKEGWFTGSAHALIGPDGVHPTEQGHSYLALLIEPLVSNLISQAS